VSERERGGFGTAYAHARNRGDGSPNLGSQGTTVIWFV
jgi:hypothetical protein